MAQLQIELADLQEFVKIGKREAIETLTQMGFPAEETADGKLNIEVTPNRPDALCVEGLARALRCYLGEKPKAYKAGKPKITVEVDKSVLPVRPAFGGAVVRKLKMTGSLVRSIMQVQEKLHETLGRKRRKVAIGMHDLGAVRPPFRYFACGRGEISFVPLDMQEEMTPGQILSLHPKGIAYSHLVQEKCPMITDRDGNVLSFPPIINGERTKLSEKTADIFIDTTGTSGEAVRQAVNIICAMLADRGGEVEQIKVNGKAYPILQEEKWALPTRQAERLLGIKLGGSKAGRLLERMGHRVEGKSVFVQGYRTDIISSVDLIEDIAIAYGFNSFEPTLPSFSSIGSQAGEPEYHSILIGLGFEEAVSWTLSNRKLAARANLRLQPSIEMENPLTEEFTIFRQALLPNLMQILSDGKNEKLPIKIYEIGPVASDRLEKRMAFAIMHPKASFSEIKGAVCALFGTAGKAFGIKAESYGPFIAGRCAAVYFGERKIGHFGEISPEVLAEFGLEQPVCAAEFELA
ncbi:MAG: phenylalanine--tRNA ligase subunit beta [Candidatus Micrarchaeota archaeon]|nr:phenylalanine--tRNA ligase subunit beta [Candidatus Micrarchaeota archaeon]